LEIVTVLLGNAANQYLPNDECDKWPIYIACAVNNTQIVTKLLEKFDIKRNDYQEHMKRLLNLTDDSEIIQLLRNTL